MSPTQLQNYLLSHRKRLGLSQGDVAFLLGCISEAKVSRYEQFRREPSFRTALALEAIFRKPASELFAGIYEEAEQDVMRRAKALARSVAKRKRDPETERKLLALAAIAPRITNEIKS